MSSLGSSFGGGHSTGPSDEKGLGEMQASASTSGRGGAARGFSRRDERIESGDITATTDIEHGSTEPE